MVSNTSEKSTYPSEVVPNVLFHIIVVQKLIGSYDTHYGVRSVVHEVQSIAVQLVADAHIQGRLRAKYVDFFDHLDL